MCADGLMNDKVLFSFQSYWLTIPLGFLFGGCFFALFRNHASLLNEMICMIIHGSSLDKTTSIIIIGFFIVAPIWLFISVSSRKDIYESKIIKFYFFGLLKISVYQMADLRVMKIKYVKKGNIGYYKLSLIFDYGKIHFDSTSIGFSNAYYYLTEKYKDKMVGEGWLR